MTHSDYRPLVKLEGVPPSGFMPYIWGLEEGDFTKDQVNRAAIAWTNVSRTALYETKIKAIYERMNDHNAMHAIIRRSLGKDDLTVLRIFRRYHGFVNATVMTLELVARGLAKPETAFAMRSSGSRPPQPLQSLDSKLAIRTVSVSSQKSFTPPLGYVCIASCWTAVEPLPSLRATVDLQGPAPQTATTVRTPIEFLMELQAFEAELVRIHRWPRTMGKILPPPIVKRLAKALPGQGRLFQLFADILAFAGLIDHTKNQVATYTPDSSRSPTVTTDVLMAMHRCLQGWMMGVCFDETDPVTSRNLTYSSHETELLWSIRALTVWGLQAAANTTDGWINSRRWLEWLYSILELRTPAFYGGSMSWNPRFAGYGHRDLRVNDAHIYRASWMQSTGRLILCGLINVLAPMGLVECGPMDVVDPVFRFTPFGLAFFGRPDRPFPKSVAESGDKPIVVQSNFEIVAPLATMAPNDAMTLAKFAKLTSAAGSPVQTFVMSDETIFRGLDAGLTIEAIQSFLTSRGKTPLPANVERMLATWAANRERLVFSERVTVTIQPDGSYSLVPPTTKNAISAGGGNRVEWTITPDLRITPTAHCSELSKLILCRITETTDDSTYRLTKAAIAAAIARGATGPQIETWLMTYAGPSFREHGSLTLKNWLNPGSSTLTPILLFQPPIWIDDFLDNDKTFQSFIVDVVDSGFLIDASRKEQFDQWLVQHGFDIEAMPKAKLKPANLIRVKSKYDHDERDDEYFDEDDPVASPILTRENIQGMSAAMIREILQKEMMNSARR